MRKYFGTDGVRGAFGQAPITVDFAVKMGNALAQVLNARQDTRPVIIGQDTRGSSDSLKYALVSGLAAGGVHAINLGVVPTPVLAYMTKQHNGAAGVMISASHNKHSDNGIKVFSAEGMKLSDAMERALEEAIDADFYYAQNGDFGQLSNQINQVDDYIEYCLKQFYSKVNYGGKVLVDCAHGASYRVADRVLSELGVNYEMIASQPNGKNINADCGAVALKMLAQKVVESGAALGIAFDGDGDRIMLVDEKGATIDGDQIIYLMAKHPNIVGASKGYVGTVMTNLVFEKSFKNLGTEFARAKVGDRYVMEQLTTKGWSIGGEASGHIINLHYNTTGDGLMAALQMLAIFSQDNRKVSEITSMTKMPQIMINVPLKSKLDGDDMSLLFDDVVYAEKSLGDRGRVVLRPSGTEPVLRVMVEADEHTLAEQYVDYLVGKVKEKLGC